MAYILSQFICILIVVVVRIGFEETSYTVSEETGFQEVCVHVFAPTDDQPLDAEITAAIETVAGTAGIYVFRDHSNMPAWVAVMCEGLNNNNSY